MGCSPTNIRTTHSISRLLRSSATRRPVTHPIRKAVTSAPLIPGLKALTARRTGDAAWNHIRPPHLTLGLEGQAKLFADFDACGLQLAA